VFRKCSEAEDISSSAYNCVHFPEFSRCFFVQDPQNGGCSVRTLAGPVQPQRAAPRTARKLSELVVWGAAALWSSGACEEACTGQRSIQRGNEWLYPSLVRSCLTFIIALVDMLAVFTVQSLQRHHVVIVKQVFRGDNLCN
jgi:hypothetical protein